MRPVHEVYENISYNKVSTTPSMKLWMGSGGGIVTMLAVLILTFPISIALLPVLIWMRDRYYRSITYRLDAPGQMVVILRNEVVQTSIDLRRVTDIKFEKNGNIWFFSKDRFAKKTKLFSVDSEAFKRDVQATWRAAQPATQADFLRREQLEQAVYGG